MKLTLFLFISILIFVSNTKAQKLYLKNKNDTIFIEHTVSAKETYTALFRLYNVIPKDIATYNSKDMKIGLNIDEKIKIPLTDRSFIQGKKTADSLDLLPVIYIPKDNEKMIDIAEKFNKINVDDLKKWSNFNGDIANAEMEITVGYLAVTPASKLHSRYLKPTEATTANVSKENTITNPVTKVEEIVKVTPPEITTKPIIDVETNDPKEGFFGVDFKSQTNPVTSQSGDCGVFKTSSGKKDMKYYCLHNNAPIQSYVLITSKTTGKKIYAKVLDKIPEIAQNEGQIVKLSNAAAVALGETEDTFKCIIIFLQ